MAGPVTLDISCARANDKGLPPPLITAFECDEVGLGSLAKSKGKRIGTAKADEIIELFELVPPYRDGRFRHFEDGAAPYRQLQQVE